MKHNKRTQRERHADREIVDFNNEELDGERVQGTVTLSLEKIASYWFKDLKTQWRHNKEYIEALRALSQTRNL